MDIATLGYLMSLPVLLVFLMQISGAAGKFFLLIERVYLTFAFALLLFLELCTFPFMEEYGQRPNRLFVEYLVYPKEVFNLMVNNPYHLISSIVIIILMIAATVFLWKMFRKYLNLPLKTSLSGAIIVFLIMGNVTFICARSSFHHRPFNLAKAYFSTNQTVNALTGNSVYSLISSVKTAYGEHKVSYPEQLEKDMLSNIKTATGFDFSPATEDFPTLNHLQPTAEFTGANVVVILQESMGAQFVKSLGGRDLTPNLDKLCAEYWCFSNMYATGVRSIRGIEAVTTGFTPTANRAVVKREHSQRDFFNLAYAFREKGYENLFIYGGESNFDNMRSFFLGNGYTSITDYEDYDSPSFVGTWGVSDEDLFNKALEKFDNLAGKGKPFYALLFTSSNHDPFEIPEGKIQIQDTSGNIKQFAAIKYADYALGRFVGEIKKRPYYQNTIFLVIADHDARVTGRNLVPVNHFHIPAVIFGGNIEKRLEKQVVSQIDMPKTLLSLAGIEMNTPMLGYDLTNLPEGFKGRAMMQYYNNFLLLQNDGKVALVQPENPVMTMHYDKASQSLTPVTEDKQFNDLALSYALFGERAYQKGYYLTERKVPAR